VNDATAARATTRPAVFAATEHGSRTVPVLGLGALVAVAAHLRRAASTSLAAKAASPPLRLRGTGTSLRFAASAWLCKRCGACSSCREQATHDGSGSARRRQAPCCSGTISGVSYGSDHASGLSPLGNPPRGGCSQRRTAAGACAAVAKHSSERTQSEFESRSPGDCRTRCQRGCSFVNAEASIARRSLLEFPKLGSLFRLEVEACSCVRAVVSVFAGEPRSARRASGLVVSSASLGCDKSSQLLAAGRMTRHAYRGHATLATAPVRERGGCHPLGPPSSLHP
jgi:hypothetical protein